MAVTTKKRESATTTIEGGPFWPACFAGLFTGARRNDEEWQSLAKPPSRTAVCIRYRLVNGYPSGRPPRVLQWS